MEERGERNIQRWKNKNWPKLSNRRRDLALVGAEGKVEVVANEWEAVETEGGG